MKPEIIRQDGTTTIDGVIVNLSPGMDAPSCERICGEFKGKERKVYLVNSFGEYDCSSILNLLAAYGEKGAKFTIKVLGEDKLAEQLALRIYSALTSSNSSNIDFSRFEERLESPGPKINIESILNEVERERRKILVCRLCEMGLRDDDVEIKEISMKILRGLCALDAKLSLDGIFEPFENKRKPGDYNNEDRVILARRLGEKAVEQCEKGLSDDVYKLQESIATLQPEVWIKSYTESFGSCHGEAKRNVAKLLRCVLPSIARESLTPIKDAEYDFFRAYLNSKYTKTEDGKYKPDKEILEELIKFVQAQGRLASLANLALLFPEQIPREWVELAFPDQKKEILEKLEETLGKSTEGNLARLIHLTQKTDTASNQDIDYKRLKEILDAGKAKDLAEMAECSLIDIRDYLVLKVLGKGAIKTAYLARSKIHPVDEAVFLQIDPKSKGFDHHRNVYQSQNLDDAEIMQKIYDTEFSATKLKELKPHERMFIALVDDIRTGEIQGEQYFFIKTSHKYEKTLEGALKPHPKKPDTRTPIEIAIRYFFQLCYALNNCHKHGIVHKDLKYDNIGVDADGRLLLSDFGCTSIFSEDADCRYQCPLELRPPELAHGEEYWRQQGVECQSDLFTSEANVWSAGVMLYRMLTGERLFKVSGERVGPTHPDYKQQNDEVYQQIQAFPDLVQEETEEKVKEASSKIQRSTGRYSEGCWRLLKLCLRKNPNKRKGALAECMRLCEGMVPSLQRRVQVPQI